MTENVLLKKLMTIMDDDMAPPIGRTAKDFTAQVCPLVSVKSLDELVGMKIHGESIEKVIVTGVSGVENNSQQWLISYPRILQGFQALTITFEPSGTCQSFIYFYPNGT